MRIECRHGFYIFEEQEAGEISKFASKFELGITRREDGLFTFDDLVDAESFSIEGVDYLGVTATVTFEGKPWEVMRANNLVYDFTTGTVKRISQVTRLLQVQKAANYFLTDGMILGGSVNSTGSRVSDFLGFYIWASAKFRYTELSYV
jgi:hypothetical protein